MLRVYWKPILMVIFLICVVPAFFRFPLIYAAGFTNPSLITITDNAPASPYPTSILVSGLPGVVDKVTVTLHGLAHTFPDDVDVLLEGPGGETIILLSDVGGDSDVAGLNITLDDSAVSNLPNNSPLVSGVFRPTDFTSGDIFPPPAPGQPYATILAALNGIDPNGTWNLYVQDDVSQDSGEIVTGWSLDVKVAPSSLSFTTNNDTLDEGDTAVIVDGSFVDPDTADSHTVTVDWGDGSSPTLLSLPPGVTTFGNLAQHTYVDDNPTGTTSDLYNITVTVTDADGGSVTESLPVFVKNIPPVLANLNATTVIENGYTTFTGDIVDPGVGDTFGLAVNWGDGSAIEMFTYAAGETNFSETHQYVDDNPSGTPTDDYQISVVLIDDDTGSGVGNTAVTVLNSTPVLSSLSTTAIEENGTTQLTGYITDVGSLDSFELEVNWGDGSSQSVFYSNSGNFTLTHVYSDDNAIDSYPISLLVTDDDGGEEAENITVTVTNVEPLLSAVAATLTDENGFTTLSGLLSDPGTLDTFTLEVDWGDGGLESFSYPAGTTTFAEVHQYLDDNPSGTLSDTFPITLTVIDDDEGSGEVITAVTVNNLPPALTDLNITPYIFENQTITLTGSFVDIGTQDTFTLTVDWADSYSTPLTFTAATSFTLTHRYEDDNFEQLRLLASFPLTLTLMDDDTGEDEASINVNVINIAPDLENVTITDVSENGLATLTGQINEVSPLDTFTLFVDWGDGISETFNYPAGTTAFTETHQYLNDGPAGTSSHNYIVSLTLTDDEGEGDDWETAVTVTNVAPDLLDLQALSPVVTEGGNLIVTGTITDPGTLDQFTLRVNWGEGPEETFPYSTAAPFTLIHPYPDDNPSGTPIDTFPITLTIQDDDMGTTPYTLVITITNATPSVQVTVVNSEDIYVGDSVNFTGQFTDTGELDVHTLTWDFGDGSTPVTTTGLSTTHIYSRAGTYAVTLTVEDDDQGHGEATVPVSIHMYLYFPIVHKSIFP